MDENVYKQGLQTAYANGYTERWAKIYAEAYVKGYDEGHAEEYAERFVEEVREEYLNAVRAVMKAMGISAEGAMELLNTPREVREKLASQLAKEQRPIEDGSFVK